MNGEEKFALILCRNFGGDVRKFKIVFKAAHADIGVHVAHYELFVFGKFLYALLVRTHQKRAPDTIGAQLYIGDAARGVHLFKQGADELFGDVGRLYEDLLPPFKVDGLIYNAVRKFVQYVGTHKLST